MSIRPSTELADMGARIIADNQKNNHCTADPIFVVQARKRVYGIDTDYEPLIEWQHGDDYTALDEAAAKVAEDFFQEHFEIPACISAGKAWDHYAVEDQDVENADDFASDLKRLGYHEYWEFVQPFFTEQAAEHFIATNSHNYRKGLRVYVDSAFRNWEWQAIREHLMATAQKCEADPR